MATQDDVRTTDAWRCQAPAALAVGVDLGPR